MSDQKDLPFSAGAGAQSGKPATAIRSFQAVPVLRHMRLWQKLLCIVVVLLVPNLFLLKDFVSRASQDIVRARSELCLDQHSRALRVVLQYQVDSLLRAAEFQMGALSVAKDGSTQVENALAELGRLQASGCAGVNAGISGRMRPALAGLRGAWAQSSAEGSREADWRMREQLRMIYRQMATGSNLGSAADLDSELVNEATRSTLPEAAWRLATLWCWARRLSEPGIRPSRRGHSSSVHWRVWRQACSTCSADCARWPAWKSRPASQRIRSTRRWEQVRTAMCRPCARPTRPRVN